MYFTVNCVTLGSRELIIRPNVKLFRDVLGFPGRKLFVTLYIFEAILDFLPFTDHKYSR